MFLIENYPEKSFNGHIFAVAICSLDWWGSGGKGVTECVYIRLGANKAILDMENNSFF